MMFIYIILCVKNVLSQLDFQKYLKYIEKNLKDCVDVNPSDVSA